MSLRYWLWLSIGIVLVCLALLGGYTYLVFVMVPQDFWSWAHQFVATFSSVVLALAISVWLYAWQTSRATADRKRDLRVAVLIAIFDLKDLVSEDKTKTVTLPDGSEEKVVLTRMQPTIFEEAVRSGLFGASETFLLSRLSALAELYNMKTIRFLETYSGHRVSGVEHADDAFVEELRRQIHAIQGDLMEAADGCEDLMKRWSFAELKEAIDIAAAGTEDETDPRVEQLVRTIRFRVNPPGNTAGLYDKLWGIEDAATSGDRETACTLADGLIEEVRAMSENGDASGES
jgi:hypothetical protein